MLSCCTSDAESIFKLISKNYDDSINFQSKLVTDNNYLDKKTFLNDLRQLFKTDINISIAFFYFSGHGGGSSNSMKHICLPNDEVLTSHDLLNIVNESKIAHKVLILDSCFSGGLLDMSSLAVMDKGVTLISACRDDETALSGSPNSIFTNLLIRALSGEASDIRGYITASSIYSYIDSALDRWKQRPVFKTHVSEFEYIRKSQPRISANVLNKIPVYFKTSDSHFYLNPSYEPVRNNDEELEKYGNPNEENVKIFRNLQMMERNGLVEPYGLPKETNNMYWVAIYSKSCVLTDTGKGYWYRAKKNLIE